MAVSATGAYAGSLSGGCVEAAVVGEALRVLESGAAGLVRFGAGSRYLDIRLPCGGAIDLLFSPNPPQSVLLDAHAALTARRPAGLILSLEGAVTLAEVASTGWVEGRFHVRHDPDLRVVIVGHGAETEALARLSQSHGAEVRVLSPDERLVDRIARMGLEAARLLTPSPSPELVGDRQTAIVFLFHDHDWEPALLAQALATDAFFIGAMGSRQTHAQRCAALLAAGVPEPSVERVIGPLGLIPATRDPETLALSTLSQIAAQQQFSHARDA